MNDEGPCSSPGTPRKPATLLQTVEPPHLRPYYRLLNLLTCDPGLPHYLGSEADLHALYGMFGFYPVTKSPSLFVSVQKVCWLDQEHVLEEIGDINYLSCAWAAIQHSFSHKVEIKPSAVWAALMSALHCLLPTRTKQLTSSWPCAPATAILPL